MNIFLTIPPAHQDVCCICNQKTQIVVIDRTVGKVGECCLRALKNAHMALHEAGIRDPNPGECGTKETYS